MEFNVEKTAKLKWKMTKLKGRKYEFIIGIDLMNCFNTVMDLVEGQISFNNKKTNFIMNPYKEVKVFALEATNFDWNRIQLDHLNKEEYDAIVKVLNNFKGLFFKEGDQLTSTMEIQHEIRTVTDEQINSKLYRYPHNTKWK